ncbi:class I SAM-dependent methyltransferase [Mumia zhuanghuii]|uniref:Class I SAM-dependent methyltransferase n=2 Tax=Mumia TaxID=1546255 RepID=A0ABW1QJ19_9ACTN|nr:MULTISPECIES: class I SAM-dependent methyltransferase [Mumia]KAA1423704.1 class I SAM-dependent methyltransferase [Mumia zhuanghuii]
MAVPARVTAAVDALPLTPASDVLEIGCGPGAAAALILERLCSTGSYLGVDRSAVSERRTRQRCADVGPDARWDVVRGAIEEVTPTLPDAAFDVVLAVNVNVFWTTDASELVGELRRTLRVGGCLSLFYEAPAGLAGPKVRDGVERSLTGGGFPSVVRLSPSPRVSEFRTANDA